MCGECVNFTFISSTMKYITKRKYVIHFFQMIFLLEHVEMSSCICYDRIELIYITTNSITTTCTSKTN